MRSWKGSNITRDVDIYILGCTVVYTIRTRFHATEKTPPDLCFTTEIHFTPLFMFIHDFCGVFIKSMKYQLLNKAAFQVDAYLMTLSANQIETDGKIIN